MYRILREETNALSQRAVDFAQKLVEEQSPSLGEEAVAGLIETQMNALSFDRVFRDEAGNLVGVLFGRHEGPTLALISHMDHVVHEDTPAIHHAGCIEEGLLYGPGSADCKAGLSAHLFAAQALKRSLLPLKGNLVVAATVAEESGGSVGVRTLIEQTLPQLELKPDYAVLGEPTGLGLYYGHDGWIELEVQLESLDPFELEDATRAIISNFNGRGGDARVASHEPVFQGQTGVRRATIQMDRRMKMTEDVEEIVGQVRNIAMLAAQPSGSVVIKVAPREVNQKLYTGCQTIIRRMAAPWSTDPFSPLIERSRQALNAAGLNARPGKWMLDRFTMGTAGNVLVNEFNIPTIGYGPGAEAQAHTPDEFVRIDNISQCILGTASIAHTLIGVPVFGWTSDDI